jgi:hypothetical protein
MVAVPRTGIGEKERKKKKKATLKAREPAVGRLKEEKRCRKFHS